MPAINVAKTDTFEIQRNKINDIGVQIFNVTAGGSDLATGELKLGDGTKPLPSLAFTSDPSLGFYKAAQQEIGFVSAGKDIVNYRPDGIFSFQDLYIRKRTLLTDGLNIQAPGQNYDSASYTDISTTGGSGSNGSINLDVEAFGGVFTSVGSGYGSGQYSDIPLVSSGSGSGVIVTFGTVEPVFVLNNAGSGYDDEVYSSIPTTSSGSGTGLVVNITIESGSITEFEIDEIGTGHSGTDTFTISNSDLTYFDELGVEQTSGGSGIQFGISNDPTLIDSGNFDFLNKGTGHAVNDVLTTPVASTKTGDLPGIVSALTTTLSTGSTNIVVSSTAGILPGMILTQTAGDGAIASDTTVVSVVNGTTLQISLNPEVDGTATLDIGSESLNTLSFSDVSDIIPNSGISGGGYTGVVSSVNSEENTIEISPDVASGGATGVTFSISPPYGSGTGFQFTIDAVGVVTSVAVNNAGNGYAVGDVLTVNPLDLTQAIEYEVNTFDGQEITVASGINVSVGSVINGYTPADSEAGTPASYGDDLEVIEITGGTPGNATSFIADGATTFEDGGQFGINSSGVFTVVGTPGNAFRYRINTGDGSGFQTTPTLTLFEGNTYYFNQIDGSFGVHPISVSQHSEGSRNVVTGITATLSTSSNIIAVSDATGIEVGMIASVTGGVGTIGIGDFVTDINGNNVTISGNPTGDGAADLEFTGAEYTENVVVGSSGPTITITASTPNPLYYYCPNHGNVGGQFTIDANNPKVFGSGLEILVSSVDIIDIIKSDIADGKFTSVSLVADTSTIGDSVFTNTISSPVANLTSVVASNINATAGANLNISSATANIVVTAGQLTLSGIVLDSSLNSITTTGEIKTTNQLNINDKLTIINNSINTTSLDDILLTPGLGRVAKVNTTTALTLPVGDTNARPTVSNVESGMVRFNTDTNQYEGYSASAASWSSLGGVRDLDGNTYILAEEFVGANDNTLYFVNDAVTTLKLDRNFLDFAATKNIKSTRVGAPSNRDWNTNTPVNLGEFLKYGLNLFEVMTAGVTGTSGNEPTDTTGSNFNNGSAVLRFDSLAVAPLDIDEVEVLRIGASNPIGLQINGELSFKDNIISTLVNDLEIKPNSGQKVFVNAATSLVIPVGDGNSRGNAAQGSIRYNTQDQTFEGYNGAQWGSLGGVKDVDGNTYILPETAPGANENILYFYNNNVNTLRVTETQLEFREIDTITSLQVDGASLDTLNINANLVTFENLGTSIDNTSTDRTFFLSTKENFDFGLSSGLTTDTLLRLKDTGDIFFNLGFGTGVYSELKLLNEDLTTLELSKYRLHTNQSQLVKNVLDQGFTTLYNPTNEASAKVTITAHNKTSSEKEFLEFAVIDNGTDILYTEYNNMKTGGEIISVLFDFDSSGDVRVTYTLDTNLNNNNAVDVTVVTHVTKR